MPTRRRLIAGSFLWALALKQAAATTVTQQVDELIVYADGVAKWGAAEFRCALGRNGVSAGKKEGDLTTPAGSWPFRQLLYRADRMRRPSSQLPMRVLERSDGWSDDTADPEYNRLVKLPRPTRAEQLWRNDHLYDLIVPVGYNDNPVVPGLGSAIFVHVARSDYSPTAGCVAFAVADLLAILATATTSTRLVVKESASRR